MNDNVKLNDSVIAHFVKLLQLGLLTGTDIVDHFRMVSLTLEDGELFLNKDYEDNQEKNIDRMLEQVSELAETQEQ